MGDQAQFEVLMRSLMSENNDQRKAAEAQFEALVRTPPQAAPLMCTAMAACSDHTVRSMTTIMFRKRVDAKFFAGLDPATQVGLRGAALLEAECRLCRVPPSSSFLLRALRPPLFGRDAGRGTLYTRSACV